LTWIRTTPDRDLADVVGRLARAGSDPAGAVAAVAALVSARSGRAEPLIINGSVIAADPAVQAVPVDDGLLQRWGPWLPGLVREAVLSREARHRQGVYHTPPEVVRALLLLTLNTGSSWNEQTRVLDPAVGGGAFLLAAAELLAGPRANVASRLVAVDIDPLAVATTRLALALWAQVPQETLPDDNFLTGDFLDPELLGTRQVDAVVGNPPFLSQLRGSTARSAAARERIALRWAGVGRYVDEAAAFALAASECVAPGGTMTLVQPASVLAARDAEPVRQRLEATVPLVALWVDGGQRAFSAAVDTVALVSRRAAAPPTVRVGELAVPRPSPRSWGPLLASSEGVPALDRPVGVTLSEVATVTAGFRQHYYGLVGAVRDDREGRYQLITSGLIDPLTNRWGARQCRFAKQTFEAPTVDLNAVAPDVSDWVAARLVPKVLVASQTRVLEAFADETGVCVPVTPVVSVEPHDVSSLWRFAALLTSPVATALLVGSAAGTALSPGSVRVSASLIGELPLPNDESVWDEAARLAREGKRDECGRVMLRAYGSAGREDLLDWWRSRNPT